MPYHTSWNQSVRNWNLDIVMVKGLPLPAFAYPFLKIPWPFPNVPEIMPLMTGTDYTATYLPSLLGKKRKFQNTHIIHRKHTRYKWNLTENYTKDSERFWTDMMDYFFTRNSIILYPLQIHKSHSAIFKSNIWDSFEF